MCHANIQANVISDFGYGSNWYLDSDKSVFSSIGNNFAEVYYNPVPWQAANTIAGQVIVPNTTVPAGLTSAVGLGSTSISLEAFMTASNMTDIAANDAGTNWFTYFGIASSPSLLSPTAFVTPPTGTAAVVSEDSVYIGAPTAAQISGLMPTGTVGAVSSSGTVTAVTGLTVATGSSGPYVTNSGTVQCAGLDVVVNGTLLLNNLSVNAGSGGCRFYAAGAVFIEGPITYVNSGTVDLTENLQITSAEAVIMGVGLTGTSYTAGTPGKENSPEPGNNPLHTRLLDDARNPEIRPATSSSSYTTWATGVYNEAVNIGATLIQDASNLAGAAATGVSSSGQTRVSIDFSHLLLNAPVIHSRYLGTVNGVIIAEIGVFSLGQFMFNYDPVFSSDKVQILPLLKQDILCATSDPTTCNPINP